MSRPKTVGFDAGLHALDAYMIGPQDINYYRARVAYTNLSFFSGAFSNSNADQVFRLIHTQNVKSNWNFTVNFNNTGSRGYYRRQNVSDLNAAVSTWYESKGNGITCWAPCFLTIYVPPKRRHP